MGKQTVYDLLLAEAKDIGWPQHYENDLLVHDKNRLQKEDAPKEFGWVLRQCGTELLDPRMESVHLEGFISHYQKEGARHIFYWVDHNAGLFEERPRRIPMHFNEWCCKMLEENRKYHATACPAGPEQSFRQY